MDALAQGFRFLCDETRMLSGISVAYGTDTLSETALAGRAEEIAWVDGQCIPSIRPIAENSLFDLASLSKLFTCVCVMRLVEEGRLSLDETVGAVDGRFPALRDVRIGDLLSFQVGLRTPGRIDAAESREEALARLFAIERCPLPPRRLYSDLHAMIAKYLVEARSGMTLFEAVQHGILRPLGMAETFAAVPEDARMRCVCYNHAYTLDAEGGHREDALLPGMPHDPKARLLSPHGEDLCGHAGLFSTRGDMVRLAQGLLRGDILRPETLALIGQNRTGLPLSNGEHRQYLGLLCFAKHPVQYYSEPPEWMHDGAIGLSGFTGNHLSLDPHLRRFVLFLGNRCHGRLCKAALPEGTSWTDLGLRPDGVGLVDIEGAAVPSSLGYVHFKDAQLHAPIAERMRRLGWL